MQKTRNQEFAENVYAHIEKIQTRDKEYRDEYGSMCHKLPILIRTAGLAQAFAFVDARGKEAQKKVLDDLAGVLGTTKDELLTQSRSASLQKYMVLTRQSLQALLWFKRFAVSILDVERASNNEERA